MLNFFPKECNGGQIWLGKNLHIQNTKYLNTCSMEATCLLKRILSFVKWQYDLQRDLRVLGCDLNNSLST